MIKGQEFSHTFQVTESVYRGFIEIFKDKNPLHTDEAFARSKNFQGKVMHGNILNGFLSYFIGECLPDKNVIIQTQEIKFILPVYLDDTLDFHAQIEDVFESVHTLELKFHFSNMEGKKVAKGKVQIGTI
ncbi:MAG: MaoC/PaaZ C-terminal domain-containing protein [Chitinophagales bacterium]|jgi:acyl dehydratase